MKTTYYNIYIYISVKIQKQYNCERKINNNKENYFQELNVLYE